jgi:hypothetical protein
MAVQSIDNSKMLTERDLLSSIAVQPWSIGALVDRLHSTHGSLLDSSPLLRRDPKSEGSAGNRPPWHQPISEWMASGNERLGHVLKDADIDHLASDPPIPFFVRFEAAHDQAGKRLGILGSIVVADVIYGILQHDELLATGRRRDLSAQLETLSRHVFARPDPGLQEVFRRLGNVRTFPDLLQFLGPQAEFPRD